jgi:hypothetical protein
MRGTPNTMRVQTNAMAGRRGYGNNAGWRLPCSSSRMLIIMLCLIAIGYLTIISRIQLTNNNTNGDDGGSSSNSRINNKNYFSALDNSGTEFPKIVNNIAQQQQGSNDAIRQSAASDLTETAATVAMPPPKEISKRIFPNQSRDDDDVHFVFSTGCNLFQHWQAEVLLNSHFMVGQRGKITRIVSGCETEHIKREHNMYMVRLSLCSVIIFQEISESTFIDTSRRAWRSTNDRGGTSQEQPSKIPFTYHTFIPKSKGISLD